MEEPILINTGDESNSDTEGSLYFAALGSGSGPQLVFTGPGPQFVFSNPGP